MSVELHHVIRKIRKIRAYSQTHVAQKLGVNQKAYSQMELGKTHLNWEKLNKIATILSVSVFELIDTTRCLDEINLDNNFKDETISLVKKLLNNYESRITELEKENQSLKQEILNTKKIN